MQPSKTSACIPLKYDATITVGICNVQTHPSKYSAALGIFCVRGASYVSFEKCILKLLVSAMSFEWSPLLYLLLKKDTDNPRFMIRYNGRIEDEDTFKSSDPKSCLRSPLVSSAVTSCIHGRKFFISEWHYSSPYALWSLGCKNYNWVLTMVVESRTEVIWTTQYEYKKWTMVAKTTHECVFIYV